MDEMLRTPQSISVDHVMFAAGAGLMIIGMAKIVDLQAGSKPVLSSSLPAWGNAGEGSAGLSIKWAH